MGGSISRCRSRGSDKNGAQKKKKRKMRFKEGKMMEESSSSVAYKRLAGAMAAKEAEWKQERRRWKDEVRRLRKRLREKDEIITGLEEEVVLTVATGGKGWEMERAHLLVEQMRGQEALREEAVEKWKRLYLAIKTELDNLIFRTSQGERLCYGERDNVIKGLQQELKAQEDEVDALRAQISTMSEAAAKREREVDILRQSLRIMSNFPKRGPKTLSVAALPKKTSPTHDPVNLRLLNILS